MLTILSITKKIEAFSSSQRQDFSSSADLDDITKMKVNLDKERKEL